MICRNIRHYAVKSPRYEIRLRNNRSFCLSNDWRQEAKITTTKNTSHGMHQVYEKKITNKVYEDLTVKSSNDPT